MLRKFLSLFSLSLGLSSLPAVEDKKSSLVKYEEDPLVPGYLRQLDSENMFGTIRDIRDIIFCYYVTADDAEKIHPDNRNTLLMQAIIDSRWGLTTLLLYQVQKEYIDHQNNTGMTALMLATQHAPEKIVQRICAYDADVNLKNNQESGALLIAVRSKQGALEKVKILREAGAPIHVADLYGNTPLILAAQQRNIKMLEYLLEEYKNESNNQIRIYSFIIIGENGIPQEHTVYDNILETWVNFENANKETALIIACSNGDIGIAEKLLTYEAKLDNRNSQQQTPLMVAILNKDLPMVSYLVSQVLKFDMSYCKDNKEENAVTYAIKSEHLRIIKAVLNKGVYSFDLLKEGKDGKTPLMHALESNNLEIIKAVLNKVDHRALLVENRDGKTYLDIARSLENKEIYNLLWWKAHQYTFNVIAASIAETLLIISFISFQFLPTYWAIKKHRALKEKDNTKKKSKKKSEQGSRENSAPKVESDKPSEKSKVRKVTVKFWVWN